MSQKIQLAHHAGLLSKEALAFFWSQEHCETHGRLPRIAEVQAGVLAEYGETLTLPTAGRGLYQAKRHVLNVVRYEKIKAKDREKFSNNEKNLIT